MTASRFPCFECAEPFDDEGERDAHQRAEGHGFAQVQLDAIDRARWGVMGDDAPPPESAYHPAVDDFGNQYLEPGRDIKITMQHTVTSRRRLRVIQGGKR